MAWAKKLSTVRGIEATPLVIGGVLYYSLPWSAVQATDALTGATLWTWDPGVDKALWGRKACCDVVNRGVAFATGRIFASTLELCEVSIFFNFLGLAVDHARASSHPSSSSAACSSPIAARSPAG